MRKASIVLCALLVLSTLTTEAQNWQEMPVGKKFYIQSAMNYGKNKGGYWDVPGSPKAVIKGANFSMESTQYLISFGGLGYFELTVAPTPKPAKKGAASSIKRNSSHL